MAAFSRGGWADGFSLAANNRLAITSRTTRYLDGKPYDKPYQNREPFGTVGWYRTGDLTLGKHTMHAVLEYEFTHHGEKRKGSIRSPDSRFEIVAADTPDDLIPPSSDTLTKEVRTAFRIQETEQPAAERRIRTGDDPDYWRPQVEWFANGKRSAIHGPVWRLSGLLDVDLCFEAEIQDVTTGKVYPADPLVFHRLDFLHRGSPSGTTSNPGITLAFAADRDSCRGQNRAHPRRGPPYRTPKSWVSTPNRSRRASCG